MREADTACFEAAAAADAAPGDRKLRTKHARAEAWLAEANSEAVAALQLAERRAAGLAEVEEEVRDAEAPPYPPKPPSPSSLPYQPDTSRPPPYQPDTSRPSPVPTGHVSSLPIQTPPNFLSQACAGACGGAITWGRGAAGGPCCQQRECTVGTWVGATVKKGGGGA